MPLLLINHERGSRGLIGKPIHLLHVGTSWPVCLPFPFIGMDDRRCLSRSSQVGLFHVRLTLQLLIVMLQRR